MTAVLTNCFYIQFVQNVLLFPDNYNLCVAFIILIDLFVLGCLSSQKSKSHCMRVYNYNCGGGECQEDYATTTATIACHTGTTKFEDLKDFVSLCC